MNNKLSDQNQSTDSQDRINPSDNSVTLANTANQESAEENAALQNEGVSDNKDFNCVNCQRVAGKMSFLMGNLSFVYFLEYMITTSFTIACAS
jgi:hypothetical protein